MTVTFIFCDSHILEGIMTMTAAQRQRKRRAKLKNSDMNQIFVRGQDGELDERIRVAFAVQSLAKSGDLPTEMIEKIVII